MKAQRGKSKTTKKRKPQWTTMSDEARARALIEACAPLLELFATCDDVFTEDDALSAEKRRITLGRVYEQWKRTRASLDPTYDPDERPRRRIAGRPSILGASPRQASDHLG